MTDAEAWQYIMDNGTAHELADARDGLVPAQAMAQYIARRLEKMEAYRVSRQRGR